MTSRDVLTTGLVKLQKLMWWIILAWFSAARMVYPFRSELATDISRWGVFLILAATLIRIIAVTELFRKETIHRSSLIGYLLIIILLVTVLLGYLRA